MKIIEAGDIFMSDAQTLVNPINCVGAMGKGLALSFKERYPAMYTEYVSLCDRKLLDIGKLWIYKKEPRWVLNFPTKYDWRKPSEVSYLKAGLEKFLATYQEKGIRSIAFPLLGAGFGGIDSEISLSIMKQYLSACDIPVSIYLKYKKEEPPKLF